MRLLRGDDDDDERCMDEVIGLSIEEVALKDGGNGLKK